MITVPVFYQSKWVTGLITAIGWRRRGHINAGRWYRIDARLAMDINTELGLTLTFLANNLDINVE